MIEYDRSAFKGLTVSPTAWTATPPLRWFDNFAIISLWGDSKLSKVMHSHGINRYLDAGEPIPKSVGAMYESDSLKRVINANGLNDYVHILNRSNKKRSEVFNIISNDHDVAVKYESKYLFRQRFSSQIRMPRYAIMTVSQWRRGETYRSLASNVSNDLVVQHPDLSGSRGTYFASNSEEFDDAIEAVIADTKHPTNEIVISERIHTPAERSLQVCILEDSILVGPPQAQLLRNSLLTYDSPEAIQFCGGSVSPGLMSDAQYEEASRYATIIGNDLKQAGYRGIFGVDILISDAVYVIEVNLRFTGLSPLLASLQSNTPYMLLHILEHAKQEYVLREPYEEIGQGSFVTVYAQNDGSVNLTTGLYDADLNKIGDGLEDANLLPNKLDTFFVAMRVQPDESIKAGKSLAFIYSRNILFNTEGELSVEARKIVSNIRNKFTAS